MVTSIEKAQALYDAYIEGPWGIRDLSDYNALAKEGIVANDDEYYFFANTLNDGDLDDAEATEFRDRGYPEDFIETLKVKFDDASDEREKFLLSAVTDSDYSDDTRISMLNEFRHLVVRYDCLKKLSENLSDDSFDIRATTLFMLVGRYPFDQLKIKYPILEDPNPEVVKNEILSLVIMAEEQGLVEDLYGYLFECPNEVARRYAYSLAAGRAAEAGHKEIFDRVVSYGAYEEDNAFIADVIVKNGDTFLPYLFSRDYEIRNMCESSRYQRRHMCGVLVKDIILSKGMAKMVETVIDQKLETSAEIEATKKIIMEEGQKSQAIPYIKKYLSDLAPRKRANAIDLLADVAGRSAFSDIEAMIKDGDAGVRYVAFDNIFKMKPDDPLKYLDLAFDDPSENMHEVALKNVTLAPDQGKAILNERREQLLSISGWTVSSVFDGLAKDASTKGWALPIFADIAKKSGPYFKDELWNIVTNNYPPEEYLSFITEACLDGDFAGACTRIEAGLDGLSPLPRAYESFNFMRGSNFYLRAVGTKVLYETVRGLFG